VIRTVIFDHDAIFCADGSLCRGADGFIRACAVRFPLLLTSAAARADAEKLLGRNELAPLFLDILTAAEVENPKPAPDLLIATLGRIGFLLRDRNPVQPGECLVVESSGTGIEAARRAGMRSLAVTHHAAAELGGADFVRSSFEAADLDDILRRCRA